LYNQLFLYRPLLHGIIGQLLKSVLIAFAKFELISDALINSPDLNIFITLSSLEFLKIHTQIRKKVNYSALINHLTALFIGRISFDTGVVLEASNPK